MTREDRLRRLRAALAAGNAGVFIIGSAQAPILGGITIRLDQALESTDIGAALCAVAGNDPIEVLAAKGISDETLRTLNHRRDQLRAGCPVLLVFDPSDSTRVSRIADDLWKWATVIELDQPVKTWEYTAATGVIEMDRYAPALRPGHVVGPREKLHAPPKAPDR